jgi:hypothetical protein
MLSGVGQNVGKLSEQLNKYQGYGTTQNGQTFPINIHTEGD